MKPQHLTLEPCEENTDGDAVTVYFAEGTNEQQVKEWAKTAKAHECPGNIWIDTENEIEVVQTNAQPFPGFVRFQVHPTG